jgi:uncharacterized protein (DUF58 family)
VASPPSILDAMKAFGSRPGRRLLFAGALAVALALLAAVLAEAAFGPKGAGLVVILALVLFAVVLVRAMPMPQKDKRRRGKR